MNNNKKNKFYKDNKKSFAQHFKIGFRAGLVCVLLLAAAVFILIWLLG